jgi:hypothetical protein
LLSFGWQDDEIVDLGDISSARGTEMFLALWLQLYGLLRTSEFNFTIVRSAPDNNFAPYPADGT